MGNKGCPGIPGCHEESEARMGKVNLLTLSAPPRRLEEIVVSLTTPTNTSATKNLRFQDFVVVSTRNENLQRVWGLCTSLKSSMTAKSGKKGRMSSTCQQGIETSITARLFDSVDYKGFETPNFGE